MPRRWEFPVRLSRLCELLQRKRFPRITTSMPRGISLPVGFGVDDNGGRNSFLHPGDTLVCEANEMHAMENLEDKEWAYIVFKTNWTDGDSVWM